MKTDNYIQDQKHFQAKKRVEELKAYYWHLAIYVIINLFLSGSQIVDGITENKTFSEIFSDLGIYAVWFIWGITVLDECSRQGIVIASTIVTVVMVGVVTVCSVSLYSVNVER